MLNPFENPHLDAYFQRLNAPLRQLPAQDRAELHQELRQHLEALLAAYEEAGCTPDEALEAALKRFGDPTKIGKTLRREWEVRSRQGRSDVPVVLAALGLYAVSGVTVPLLTLLPAWLVAQLGWNNAGMTDFVGTVDTIGIPFVAGLLMGFLFGPRGVTGMVYTMIALLAVLVSAVEGSQCLAGRPLIVQGLGGLTAWLAWGGVCAYLGSAWRNRAFYRFPLSLLKLRLK